MNISKANNKGADQSVLMRRLVCTFVVCKPGRQAFARRGPDKVMSCKLPASVNFESAYHSFELYSTIEWYIYCHEYSLRSPFCHTSLKFMCQLIVLEKLDIFMFFTYILGDKFCPPKVPLKINVNTHIG